MRRRSGSEKTVQQLMNTMVDAITYDSLANRIVEEFARLFNADLCTLWRLVDQEPSNQLILSAGKGMQLKPGTAPQTYSLPDTDKPNAELEGVTIWIAIRKRTCLANSSHELKDDRTKPWYGSHRGIWDELQFKEHGTEFKNLLGLPVLYEGDLIAVLKIESTRSPRGFRARDRALAEKLTPFVAIALQTMEQRERHEQERQRVFRSLIGALLKQDQEPGTFYQEVVDKTAELLNADICTLWLIDKDQRKLRVSAAQGIKSTKNPEYILNWDAESDSEIEGLTPWVVIRKRPFFGERHVDLRTHAAWRGEWDHDQWEGKPEIKFGCLYAVPLIDVEGHPLGVLKIENRAGKPIFNAVERAIFDWVADFIALALEFNSMLRSDIVYDFFHLLKQPISNAITAFDTLRAELDRPEPRPERIAARLDMMAKNLETVRVWTMNVYGIATQREAVGEIAQSWSLVEILERAIRNMNSLFPDFECSICGDEDVCLELTPLQSKKLDAILFNLLDNSYKYSEPPRKIEAAITREEGSVHLSIRDNGRGIAQEDIERIFEPYFSKGMETWPSSLGLGLATVERLLGDFGWGKKVESELNQGTVFTIIVPREGVSE